MLLYMPSLMVLAVSVFITVELSPGWEVTLWGTEFNFILEGVALCATLLLLLYAMVIHESCHNA